MYADDIRSMSEALAAEPQSLVFLPLAEALLARGDLTAAARVAQRGAGRHAMRAEAHDLVARIALAQGDEARAEAAWARVLELAPAFGTAHRGLGLLRYRQGRLEEATRHLEAALAGDPDDQIVGAALAAVQRALAGGGGEGRARTAPRTSVPVPAIEDLDTLRPAELFDATLGDTPQVALLLDRDGLVTAGRYVTADGADMGIVLGAHLSGVSDEADRAMRHFGLGRWTRIVLEAEAATIALSPEESSVVLVAAPQGTPLGFVRRTLDHCTAVARVWLGRRS